MCLFCTIILNSTFIRLCPSLLLHDLNTGATWPLHCIVYRDNLALHGDGQQQRFISCIFLLRLLGAAQTSQGSRIMIQALYYEHMYIFLIVSGIVLSVLVHFSMYPLRFMYCKPTYYSWHYWAAFFLGQLNYNEILPSFMYPRSVI